MPPVFFRRAAERRPFVVLARVASLDSARMAEVSLRLLGEDDLAFLSEVVSDESTRRFTRIPEPPPAGFAQTWLGAYEAGRADGTREAFVVVEDGTRGRPGPCPVDRPRGRDGRARLPRHGPGQGPWARHHRLAAAERVGLRGARMIRLELHIGTENVASQTVARRAGYTLEGTLRSAHLKQGLREDTQIWSRLRTDVP